MSDKLVPGIYRLDRGVHNPNGDRRCTQFWRRPVWPLGTRFVIRFWDEGIYRPGEAPPLVLEPLRSDGLRVFGGKTHQAEIDLILPYLVREDDSLLSILRVQGETADGVLRRLLKAGKLTLADLRLEPAATAANDKEERT